MITLNARRPAFKIQLRAFIPLAWAGLVFLLALLPRLYALGSFLTIDEVKWAEGASQFLLALHSGRLAETYWHFHPGITITWGSALALWAACAGEPDLALCAAARVENLAGTIGWLRLSPVLLTSLAVSAVYLLGRRLAGEQWALLAALLLAFDPFFVAHSRILNGDAGAAGLMFLSLLAFLNFARPRLAPGNGQLPAANGSLLLSGILGGLAWLTKLPSPLIGAFIAGLSLLGMVQAWRQAGPAAARRWLAALLVWFAAAAATFVILWPAMWAAPLQTLRLMVSDSFNVGEVGAGHDTFFLGQVVTDPGPWFYPYVILYRLTPVVLVGLLAAIAWLVVPVLLRVFSRRTGPSGETRTGARTAWLLLAFVIFVILLANLSPKKLDRYVMSVIPPLVFLAAFGFIRLARALQPVYQPPTLDGLVMLQLLFAIFAAPYFLTYYNPLLGGAGRAAGRIPVGWGEGLEQAAFYLNSLPGAESLTVSSWYSDIFNPYFVGQRASFSDDGRGQLSADYVVFYVNQLQRQKPYPGLVDYFRSRQPAFVFAVGPFGERSPGETEGETPWVEVYQAPAAQSASGAPEIEGVLQLLAYKTAGGRVVNSKTTGPQVINNPTGQKPAEAASVALYLRVLGPLPEGSRLGAALVPPGDGPGVDWPAVPEGEFYGGWHEGGIVEWRGPLALPPGAPAGEYRLRLALLSEDGSLIAELPVSEKDPAVVLTGPAPAP